MSTPNLPAYRRLAGLRSHPAVWMALLVPVPLIYPDAYFLGILINGMMLAGLAASWNLMLGFAGIFSFGHQAFFGLGAYVSALLAMRLGLSPWLGLLAAGVVAGAVSLIIAAPCMRLRAAPYIAIATLGFAEICRITAMNLVDLTRGELGLWGIPELFGGGAREPYYYVVLVILAFIVLTMAYIRRSPLGMALRAVREGQDAAESLGVDVARIKIIAFVASSFMAGVVGAFYAHYLNILTPSSVLSVGVMTEIMAVTLLGGLGTLSGPVLGGLGVTLALEYMRALGDYRLLIYGLAIMLIVIFLPGGVVPRVVDLWRTRASSAQRRRKVQPQARKGDA
ncbi:MAG: branched-chain amino acid ABC transporter permease [Anaerolineae bacterium]